MRIVIVGAGAVGGYMAGMLARAGADVVMLARGANLAAIRERGLAIQTRADRWTVPVTVSDDTGALGAVDLAVVTAKAPALPGLAELMQPMLRPDTPVVCAMNGIPWWYEYGRAGGTGAPLIRVDPDGAIWQGIGPARAIGCVIDCPTREVVPGEVHHVGPYPGMFHLGEPKGGASARLAEVVNAIEAGGMSAPIRDDIRAAIWAKLLVNVSRSPLGVLTGATERALAENADTCAVTLAIMHEARAVARSHGIEVHVDEASNRDPAKRSEHRSSMLQDWDLGRPMEIDGIVRVVQDFARGADIATPTLDTVAALLIEKARVAGTYEG